jgi:hypothetical protein
MDLSVQLAHVKNCCAITSKEYYLKLYVSFIVVNPCIHDIYITNLLSYTARHFHPNLVSMEWDLIVPFQHALIVVKPH